VYQCSACGSEGLNIETTSDSEQTRLGSAPVWSRKGSTPSGRPYILTHLRGAEVGDGETELDFEIVDLTDYPMPLFDEATGPAYAPPKNEVALRWSQKLDELDGYLFVTAEYNHSILGVLKNALDHAYPEFNRKPAAFVGYGGVGAARAVEQLRLVCVELQMVPTRTAVHVGLEPYLGVAQEGKELSDFDFLNHSAEATLDELAWWTLTLKAGRAKAAEAVEAAR
jgi:NAD(P)H-dependent FMN reductase